MTRKLLLLAALAMMTAGMAAGTARAQAIDVIETRQAGQDVMSGTFLGIRAVVDAKGDVKKLENPAKYMARWIRQYPTLFPAGSDKGHDTKALPVIWTDNAGFKKAANDLDVAATKLAELAKAGDTDGATAQVKVVGDACAACHKTYRAR